MVWVGRDLIDHLVPTPLPRAETSSTTPGCAKMKVGYFFKVISQLQELVFGEALPNIARLQIK